MLRLSIPQPCHEKWEDMTPTEKGAYCQSCSTVVTDFSNMTDEEMANYFMEKKGSATCGRFRKSQLDRPILYISRDVLQMNIPYWKKFLAVLFICFSGLLTSCNNDKTVGIIVKRQPGDTMVSTEKSIYPSQSAYATEAKTSPADINDTCETMLLGNISIDTINFQIETLEKELLKTSPDK